MALAEASNSIPILEIEKPKKGPFSDTFEFFQKRMDEARIGEQQEVLELGVPHQLHQLDLPQFSRDPVLDARTRNALGLFFGIEEITMHEVGEKLGGQLSPFARKTVSEMIRDAMAKLHITASAELQEQYPLESLTLSKPYSKKQGERRSRAHGGATFQITQHVKEGNSYNELRKRGYSAQQIARARVISAKWGEPIYIKNSRVDWSEAYVLLKDPDVHPQVKAELLYALPGRWLYEKVRQEDSPLMQLSDVLKNADIAYNRKNIGKLAVELEKKGVPIHEYTHNARLRREYAQIYRIILRSSEEQILHILEYNPEIMAVIKPISISIEAGPILNDLPNGYELRKNYSFFYKVASDYLGVFPQKLKSLKEGASFLEERCPVTVIRYGVSLFVLPKDAESKEFRAYVKMRAEELGFSNL